MADTEHSKCSARKGVRVQVPPSARRLGSLTCGNAEQGPLSFYLVHPSSTSGVGFALRSDDKGHHGEHQKAAEWRQDPVAGAVAPWFDDCMEARPKANARTRLEYARDFANHVPEWLATKPIDRSPITAGMTDVPRSGQHLVLIEVGAGARRRRIAGRVGRRAATPPTPVTQTGGRWPWCCPPAPRAAASGRAGGPGR
jgi:hypothetical protein